ncbi:MAG: hypothetical protein U0836_24065 [Pirellulales bacterium]
MRTRLLLAATAFFCLGRPVFAQHALIKPGDVVAGKTLTAASDIAVSDTGRLVFRGAFEEAGKPQAGLFDYDLSTKAASLIASTETPFDGFALTDVGQPSLSSTGKLVWRGGLDQGAVIFGDSGPLVKTGDPIGGGKVAVDPYEPLINDAGKTAFFDSNTGYLLPATAFVSFPFTLNGSGVGAPVPNSATFIDFLEFVAFVDSERGAIIGMIPSSGDRAFLVDIDNSVGIPLRVERTYAISRQEGVGYAYLADLHNDITQITLRTALANDLVLATEKDLLDDGTRFGTMTEVAYTKARDVYVASEGRIIKVPEPGGAALSVLAALCAVASCARRHTRHAIGNANQPMASGLPHGSAENEPGTSAAVQVCCRAARILRVRKPQGA